MAGPLSFVPRKARSQLCASMIVRDVCDYLLNLTPTFIFTFTCSRRCASYCFFFRSTRRAADLFFFFLILIFDVGPRVATAADVSVAQSPWGPGTLRCVG